jgi:hypothetical protein
MSVEIVRGPSGKVIAYVQKNSENNYAILNENQRLVAREINGDTFDAQGRFVGKGRLGLTLVNR